MPNTPENQEKQRRAFVLRMAGMEWTEIAKVKDDKGNPLYSNGSAAWRAAKTYQERNSEGDDTAEHRRLAMERLDALHRSVWRKALGGDLASAKLVLSIHREQAKLLGLQGLVPHEGNQDPLDELAQRREKKSGTET